MRRALDLARRGLYMTTPNPRVGCVLVRDGSIIGEGFHARAGAAHAEVDAIDDAAARGHSTAGATAYVTLEPCNHVGRTGPCAEALLRAKVTRVVAAMKDPNPAARSGGVRLAESGVAVQTGLLEQEAAALNRGFISRIRRGRPWVRLKVAASLDGRTALTSGESEWITSAEARADGHHWRAQACAVMTGIGTVRHDDPALTVRHVATTRQPLRIVVDRHADTPADARVLQSGALLVTAGGRNAAWPADVEVLALPDGDGRVDLAALMRELGRRDCNELHVEAGAGLNGALLRAGLVDEVVLFMAGCLIGEPARGIADFGKGLASLDQRVLLDITDVTMIGPDIRVIASTRGHA